ncbi:hypothetical protein [Halovivax limisalsi]|uniref:hypothetical protein n=1 Tax=Halovivax limisalsi TaxID=1453760 RepID=UPI001FFD37DA|nr:hypothetical protein [Halovivax limisalsi]
MTTAYCEVCDWAEGTGDGTSRSDLNRAMIDHHVETGHAPIETIEADASRDEPAQPTVELDR